MSEKEEWGPWIEHDGSSQPLAPGTYIMIELESDTTPEMAEARGWRYVNERTLDGILGSDYDIGWYPESIRCIRYRIRKPKGLTILTDILREVERDGDKVYGDRELEECRV